MAYYNKGANAERELMKVLVSKGFMVVRAAGSGVNQIPCPDLLALKKGKILAFECKAWKGNYLYIKTENFESQEKFCEISGAISLIGWKIPNHGWLFMESNQLKKKGKHYSINKKQAQVHSLNLDVIAGLQETLEKK